MPTKTSGWSPSFKNFIAKNLLSDEAIVALSRLSPRQILAVKEAVKAALSSQLDEVVGVLESLRKTDKEFLGYGLEDFENAADSSYDYRSLGRFEQLNDTISDAISAVKKLKEGDANK